MDQIRRSELQRVEKEELRRQDQQKKKRKLEDERAAKAKVEKQKQQMEQKIRNQKEEDQRKQRDKDQKIRLQQERITAKESKLKADQEAQIANVKAEQEAKAELDKQTKRKEEEERKKKAQDERAEAQRQRQRAQQEAALRRNADASRRSEQQLDKLRTASGAELLDCYVAFSETIRQDSPIDTAINSIQDCRKNVKDIFIFTESMLASFDRSDPRQQNTFMVKLWDLIVMVLLRAARKEGIQEIPPTSPDAEIYKNSINSYVLVLNLMKMQGMERVWIYFVGKTLRLLEFIYKRDQPLRSVDELDLVRNRYLNFRPEFQRVYVSRLDQLTYFLFGLLAMDPYVSFTEIVDRSGGRVDMATQSDIDSVNRPWDYSTFWVLVDCVRRLPFTYFKPICYNNIFSMLYLQYRLGLINRSTNTNPFCLLYRQLVADTSRFGQEVDRSPEMKMILDTDIDNKFAGEEFFDRVEPLAKRIHAAKRRLLQTNDMNKFIKDACLLYYFTAAETTYP